MSGEPWFLVDPLPEAGTFVLTGPEGRHAATVRRMRVGERLALTDSRGGWAFATVTGTAKDQLTLDVGSGVTVRPPTLRVTLVQALPKGDRSDLAVDLATEAGVDVIVPWQAARCVSRWSGDKAARGAAKWRSVAREAAKQSRRPWHPEIHELASTADILRVIGAADATLVLHEAEASALAAVDLPVRGDLVLIVGPEGGISPDELQVFAAAGARPVRLGPEVLRTSTAGAVALGALGVLTDRWR